MKPILFDEKTGAFIQDLSDLKTGVKVYDLRLGAGVLDKVRLDMTFPLRVSFDIGVIDGFTTRGFGGPCSKIQTLFHCDEHPFKVFANSIGARPGDEIEVWDGSDEKPVRRIFSCYDPLDRVGFPWICEDDCWEHAKLPGLKEEMSPEILKALEKSIVKWDLRAQGWATEGGYGCFGCPLCRLLKVSIAGPNECKPCPIMQKTGKHGCKGTPYQEYCTDQDPETALEETLFLIDLLPEGHEWREMLNDEPIRCQFIGWDRKQNESKLGACPHCKRLYTTHIVPAHGGYYVKCSPGADGCGARSGTKPTRAEVIANWKGEEIKK